MTDRPILFSAPMARALLAGRKTQTRRVLTAYCEAPPAFVEDGFILALNEANRRYRWPNTKAVGDRLWVREAWRSAAHYDDLKPSDLGGEEPVRYGADGKVDLLAGPMDGAWGRYRHARFMPRWASRLTLTVTDVRVQRLQDISEDDAVAEGCFKGKATGRVFESAAAMHLAGAEWANARDWYADLWDEINGLGSWDANPWVVAVTFDVHRGNIDEVRT